MSHSDFQDQDTYRPTSGTRYFYPIIILILLVGFSLRIHDLDGQSMWSDEGLSLFRASLSFGEILQNVITIDGVDTQDTTPPLYFLLLHAWRALTGETVFTMRLVGVIAGLLSIPLLYVLGTATFGWQSGLIAALFLAVSPFHIWQSQVLRNYGPLVFINLLSIYGLYRYILVRQGQTQFKWLALWLVAGLLGIYTHYFAFFVFAFGILSLTVSEIRKLGVSRLIRQRWFWLTLAAGLLLLLPASYVAVTRFLAERQFDFFFVPIPTVLYRAASAFAVGMERSLVHPWWRVVPVILLSLIGLFYGWRENRSATMLVLGYLVIPLSLLLALSYINPLYNGTRHLLIGLPPFILLVSNGIFGPFKHFSTADKSGKQQYLRWAAPLLGLLVVFSHLEWVYEQFNSPRLIRDDVRGAAEVLNALALPIDLIVLHDTLIRPTFSYYYDGQAPVISIPRFDQTDANAAIRRLEETPIPGQLIWILTKPTPRTGIDSQALVDWADENWHQIYEQDFPHMWLQVGLKAYVPQSNVESLPDYANPVDELWNGALQIHSIAYPPEAISGEAWWPNFFMTPISSEPEIYTILLRFVGPDGIEWARINEVIDDGRPFMGGDTESVMRYIHRTSLPAGMPAGPYQIWMQLLRSVTGEVIPLTSGDNEIQLPDLIITSANCESDLLEEPDSVSKNIRFDQALELLAYRWREIEYRPGFPVPIDVWWCTRQTPEADYRWRLQLVNEDDRLIGETFGSLARPDHPPTQWQSDEMIMSKAQIIIPADIEEGSYDLQLSLVQPDNKEAIRSIWSIGRQSVSLGTVNVVPWPMVTDLPAVENLLSAEFSQPPLIVLYGYDHSGMAAKAGDIVELDLSWRSLTNNIPVGYKIFVHLSDDDERIIAQLDAIPSGGARPTTSWRQDEVILDQHLLAIPIDVTPGSYNIWIGLYDPATGQRLPISIDGQRQPGDRLLLQEFVINE